MLGKRYLLGTSPTLIVALLLGCSNAPGDALSQKSAMETSTSPAAATQALTLDTSLAVYQTASELQRRSVVGPALVKLREEIDQKGKSGQEIAEDILPCMNSISDQLSDAVRLRQPVIDLVAVCLVQMGFKK